MSNGEPVPPVSELVFGTSVFNDSDEDGEPWNGFFNLAGGLFDLQNDPREPAPTWLTVKDLSETLFDGVLVSLDVVLGPPSDPHALDPTEGAQRILLRVRKHTPGGDDPLLRVLILRGWDTAPLLIHEAHVVADQEVVEIPFSLADIPTSGVYGPNHVALVVEGWSGEAPYRGLEFGGIAWEARKAE